MICKFQRSPLGAFVRSPLGARGFVGGDFSQLFTNGLVFKTFTADLEVRRTVDDTVLATTTIDEVLWINEGIAYFQYSILHGGGTQLQLYCAFTDTFPLVDSVYDDSLPSNEYWRADGTGVGTGGDVYGGGVVINKTGQHELGGHTDTDGRDVTNPAIITINFERSFLATGGASAGDFAPVALVFYWGVDAATGQSGAFLAKGVFADPIPNANDFDWQDNTGEAYEGVPRNSYFWINAEATFEVEL